MVMEGYVEAEQLAEVSLNVPETLLGPSQWLTSSHTSLRGLFYVL